MERVEEIQANLAGRFPCCMKTMVRSNVTHGFWLVSVEYICESVRNDITC